MTDENMLRDSLARMSEQADEAKHEADDISSADISIVIITGLSGAGKSNALGFFEDAGYYCIDNMPPELLKTVAGYLIDSDRAVRRLAVAIDIRSGENISSYIARANLVSTHGISLKILFLDADDDTLIRRYKETRRRHPLFSEADGSLYRAIALERQYMQSVMSKSDYYIDTSELRLSELRQRISSIFFSDGQGLSISVLSFGFKFGLPKDSDLVFDVRCLPNPFYVSELKSLTGLDEPVYDYVMKSNEAEGLFVKISELIDMLIPLYIREGKSALVIAFGCTGGKHRSVSFAKRLSKHLCDRGYSVNTEHRNIKTNRA